MIGGISNLSFYYNPYQNSGAHGAPRPAEQARNTGKSGGVWTARKAASPETPVQPVRPAPAISPNEAGSARLGLPVIRQGADPVEMAVRMRIQYGEPQPEGVQGAAASQSGQPALGAERIWPPRRSGATRWSMWSGSRPRPSGRTGR